MTLEVAVLDSLADDFESLEQIKKYISFLGYEIQTDEIKFIIERLLEKKLIYVVKNISDNGFVWYGMTKKGGSFWRAQ